jgi:membrane-bound lytic murein transglycosylase B
LLAALKIVDRGDLQPVEMIGSWAGELGQTQFLPTHYFNHAIDWDGDGRRNLLKSPADVIGSTAAFIKSLGWVPNQPWLQEVRVPADLAWDQADLSVQHPTAQWAKWGVTAADGRPLATDAPPASLVLLMGRNGPAFLVFPNFQIYTKWNQSLTYAVTAAYLATRITGAPAMSRGKGPVPVLQANQVSELQTLLTRRGFAAGEPDGKLGAGTRAAIKAAQMKFGLPADSYPTIELLDRLRK